MNFIITTMYIYLTLNVVYYFFFSVVAKTWKPCTNRPGTVKKNRMAVMIPAYKEDGIICDTVRKAMNQLYSNNDYDVYVLADSLKKETMDELHSIEAVRVLELSFEKSTKSRAINKAYERINEPYDITVILDADNEMAEDFLVKVNEGFNCGYRAMQGQRAAKNSNTPIAILDGISEGINNSIFRSGHAKIGLSSGLVGSGMAFDFELFREWMSKIDAVGGFDKELELKLLKDNIRIYYLEDAVVFDEKVSDSAAFTKQRTRWISAHIRFGMQSFGGAIMELLTKGNINYFDKSLQFVMLPRLILLGTLSILFLTSLIMWNPTMLQINGGLLLICGLTLIIAMPGRYYSANIFKLIGWLPKLFLLMVYSIKDYKRAKYDFLNTPHQFFKPGQ